MNTASTSVPIHEWSMFAALRATPLRTTAGNATPTLPSQSKCSTSSAHDLGHRLGVAGLGVAILYRSARQRAGVEVDRGGLHAGAADVDAEGLGIPRLLRCRHQAQVRGRRRRR